MDVLLIHETHTGQATFYYYSAQAQCVACAYHFNIQVMEQDFIDGMVSRLSPYFEFFPQAWGTHFSGKRLRIDHIIRPKDTSLWKNKDVVFGVEYKDVGQIDGDTKNFTKWFAQCVDYANTKWDDYGYIYILTCPGLRSTGFIQVVDSHWMLARIMGRLGVGEIKNMGDRYGWAITLQNSNRVWSQKQGVEAGKRLLLERKFGNRG